MLSNTSIDKVHTAVKDTAVSSFEFLANSVLGLCLNDDVIILVTTCFDAKSDISFKLKRQDARNLFTGIVTWLSLKGVDVSPDTSGELIPHHEIVSWLIPLSHIPLDSAQTSPRCHVSLSIVDGQIGVLQVGITWL